MKKTSSYDVYSFILNGISRTHKVLAASMILTGALMCGCSDNEIVEDNGVTPEPQVAKREGVVTVGSNPNDPKLMKRITFFGKSRSRGEGDVEFPELEKEPVIPDNVARFSTPNKAQQSQVVSKKTAYVLEGGSGQIELYGGVVYITGKVSTHNFSMNDNASGSVVYVMPDAELTLTDNVQNVKIIAFGSLLTDTESPKKITLGSGAEILVKNNFYVNGNFAVEGKCVVRGELTVNGILQMNYNSLVDATCIDVLMEHNENQAVNVGGTLNIRNHLAAHSLYLNNGGSVYFWPNAVADITSKTWFSGNDGLVYKEQEGDDRIAILRTQIIRAGGSERAEAIKKLFAGKLKVKYVNKENLDGLENYEGEIPTKNCTPDDQKPDASTPEEPDKKPDDQKPDSTPEEPDEEPTVTPIAIIEGPEVTGTHSHTHLSATCIQAVGEKAYVSWHLNTEYEDNASWSEISRHMGCAEMYTVTEEKAEITSWLMNMDCDFNHLLVDGNKAYFVGDTKYYGATLGVIDLENGAFGQGTAEMPYYNLYKATAEESRGTSGNCMILDGGNYRIASHKGFQSFSADALRNGALEETDEFISTGGSAKHIAQGEGYIATLNLDEKGKNESTATITVYNPWGTVKTTIYVGGEQIITPIDGKNVIAIKDGYVYVALGQNGVAKYSIENGDLVKHFNYNKNSKSEKKPLANGLCVDDKYVYVANGAAGLIVLDKDTMEKVTSWRRTYKADDGKEKSYSANYVQKVNGLIYIAYGRDGLEVVKLEGDNK